jgi:short-subunit dehydrogenase
VASGSGRVVIITGASSGIGAATALLLAEPGVKLVLGARRMEPLERIAAQCRERGASAIALACDVSCRDQVDALVAKAISSFGRLDVMIANAGFAYVAKVHNMTEKQFDELFDVNVKGTWYCMQAAAAVMLPQKSGHVITVSSAAALRGLPMYGAYSMTKAAQLSLAESMRVELSGTGVMVSTVHPITTQTEFFDTAGRLSNINTSGVGKSQTAAYVAKKIVKLIDHPRPECWPSRGAWFGLVLSRFCPGMTDKGVAKMLKNR